VQGGSAAGAPLFPVAASSDIDIEGIPAPLRERKEEEPPSPLLSSSSLSRVSKSFALGIDSVY
jgi:hypothetical protein